MSCSAEQGQCARTDIWQEQPSGILGERAPTSRGSAADPVAPVSCDAHGMVSTFCGWLTVFVLSLALGVAPASANTYFGSGSNRVQRAEPDHYIFVEPSNASPVALRAKARARAGRKPARRPVRSEVKEIARSATSVPILLVEDSTLFREGLKLILASTQFEVVASASCVEELASIRPTDANGILLLGIGGDHAAAVRHVRSAHKYYPSMHCVVLSDHYDPLTVGAVMNAGAIAYLLKSNSKAAFVKALEMVMLGSIVLPTAATAATMHAGVPSEEARLEVERPVQTDLKTNLPHHLSAREIATLHGLKAGYSNKHIAREFAIAEATVKVHVKAILRKIRVANRTQAAIWAMRNLPSRPVDETIEAPVAMNDALVEATGDRSGFAIASVLPARTVSADAGLSTAQAAI